MSYPVRYIRPRDFHLHGDPPPVPEESVRGDTKHNKDNVLSRTIEGWVQFLREYGGDPFASIGRGLAEGFGVSETTMWLIAAGLAVYLITQKKGRR